MAWLLNNVQLLTSTADMFNKKNWSPS